MNVKISYNKILIISTILTILLAIKAIFNLNSENNYLYTTKNNTISELNQISDVSQYTDSRTLVLVDLDNTLITTPQTIGNNKWFEYLLGTYKKQGLDSDTALDKAVAKWTELQYKIDLAPIENTTATTIKKLQEQSLAVFALTARPYSLSKHTDKHLKNINIDFNYKNNLSNFTIAHNILNYKVTHYNGIIASIPKNKGDTLKKFLSSKNTINRIDLSKLKKIIFIDDKSHNLKSVANAALDLNIEFIGFRYSGADYQGENFSKKIASKQLELYEQCGLIIADNLVNTASC